MILVKETTEVTTEEAEDGQVDASEDGTPIVESKQIDKKDSSERDWTPLT